MGCVDTSWGVVLSLVQGGWGRGGSSRIGAPVAGCKLSRSTVGLAPKIDALQKCMHLFQPPDRQYSAVPTATNALAITSHHTRLETSQKYDIAAHTR